MAGTEIWDRSKRAAGWPGSSGLRRIIASIAVPVFVLVAGLLPGQNAAAEIVGPVSAEWLLATDTLLHLAEQQTGEPPALFATRRHPKLERTLDQLAMETDPAHAGLVEQVVWHLWLDSGSPEIDRMVARAKTLMAAGDNVGALRLLDQVVVQAPEFSEGWNKRATVLYLLGRLDQSVLDCQKVLSLEPRHFGALAGLGLISLALGRKEAALEAYRLAIKVHPMMPGAAEMIDRLTKETEGDPT